MTKILILDADSLQALALSKYIKKYSNYYLVGCTEIQVKFSKFFYDETIVSIYNDLEIDNYSYVLPTGAKSTYWVFNRYHKLCYKNGIEFNKNNLIVFNKLVMLGIVQELDIPVPKTFSTKEKIEKFPIFYKEDFEQGGGKLGIAYKLSDIPSGNLLYQEYIDTPYTYGVGFLAKDGEIITFTMHKELLSYPKDGGSAVVIESFEDRRLFQYVQIIVKKMNYYGWGLAEFKYCNQRKDYIFMEINAKFWASVEFALLNNPKFLNLLLNIEYDKKNINLIVFINRLFRYDLIYFLRNFKYLFAPYKIFESSLFFQIARKIIPSRAIKFIKMIKK